jgi:hypothetical protein
MPRSWSSFCGIFVSPQLLTVARVFGFDSISSAGLALSSSHLLQYGSSNYSNVEQLTGSHCVTARRVGVSAFDRNDRHFAVCSWSLSI